MIDGKFTAKERAYLASLPAVKSVSPSHIRYTDRFKVEVMCRYNAGESPSAIFREAGLDPKLIGYKRVERCIARWKQQEERNKRRNEHTNHYMQDCDDELEAIDKASDMKAYTGISADKGQDYDVVLGVINEDVYYMLHITKATVATDATVGTTIEITGQYKH